MNIVIVGDGKVGSTLSEMLSEEGHNVTIIDSSPKILQRHTEEMDIIGILGNGACMSTQVEAGVEDADVLIAATSSDEINMLSCLLARKLGCKNTIARIRNPEYSEQLQLLREDLGLSFVINPELSTAREIANILSFPNADSITSLAEGRVRMVRYTLEPGSPLAGLRPMDLRQRKGNNVVICAVERGGEAHIPKGDFVLKEYDHVYLTGTLSSIDKFLEHYGERKFTIRKALIVGGGRITFYLAKILKDMRIHLTIIDKNPEKCVALKEQLPYATVVEADGSDQVVLDEEGVRETDALIALTDRDEENLIISMYGQVQQVPKTITKINRTGSMGIIEKIGLDSIISPKHSVASQIAHYVRAQQNSAGSRVDSLHRIVGGRAEALEFIVHTGAYHLGTPLRELPLVQNLLVVGIVRGWELIFPTGDDFFQLGDRVVVVTNNTQFDDFNDIFTK